MFALLSIIKSIHFSYLGIDTVRGGQLPVIKEYLCNVRWIKKADRLGTSLLQNINQERNRI